MDLSFLPAVNAGLNGLATCLLIAGWFAIRKNTPDGKKLHRVLMTAAFATSVVFLASYLTHYYWRASVKGGTHTSPSLTGVALKAYYLFLIVHILFATAVPVLALRQFYLAIKSHWDAHRFWGRITMPIWLYTGVTGVLIYFVLYVWFPAAN